MLPVVVIWVWLCAYLNCAGWGLSAGHALNRAGYAAVLAVGLIMLVAWACRSREPIFRPGRAAKLRWRLRHFFPLAFFILAGLAFLGGALYLPANYDALAYRTPRTLNWLAENHWYWIHTEFARLNTRTAGFEWGTAPLMLFTHTDRFNFLPNIVCFLLLPGRVFAVLTRLGVRPRTAWYWMWLFPSGYGYLLQAGSVVNDMFGGFMTLVAFEFALRAAQKKDISLFWTSLPAVGLMTAVKAFNIVLLLPWAVAALPILPLLRRRPLVTVMVIILAAGASIVPTAVLNQKACGDWTGLKAEQPTVGGSGKIYRFISNAVNLPLENLTPPVFPFTAQWDRLMNRVIPPKLESQFAEYMETGAAQFATMQMAVEESSGLGLGVTLLLLVLLVKKIRAESIWPVNFWSARTLVPLATWASLGVFMMESGASGPARYLLPFHVMLAAPILTGITARNFFRNRLWHGVAGLVFVVAAVIVIITPPRPLWPARTVLQKLDAEHSANAMEQRLWNVYYAYGTRADAFEPVITALPPDTMTIGFMGFDEPEAGLWRPFGSRRVVQVCQGDSPALLASKGIKYALVSERFFGEHSSMTSAEWLQQTRGTVVEHFDLKLRAGQPPAGWLLVRFD